MRKPHIMQAFYPTIYPTILTTNNHITITLTHTHTHRSGLDVDKMDYFARDMKRTLGSGQVNFMLIEEAFVAKGLCGQGLVKKGDEYVKSKCCR